MPTTSTSQFALYQALFVKVSQSLLLCYKCTVYFLVFFFRCVQEDLFLAIEVNCTRTRLPVEKREEIWGVSSPSPLCNFPKRGEDDFFFVLILYTVLSVYTTFLLLVHFQVLKEGPSSVWITQR